MTILDQLRGRVKAEFPKEFACHIFFVHEVARNLQAKYGGDDEIVEIAALTHDIGRVEEGDNTLHPEIGSEKILPWLRDLRYDECKVPQIARCILMHNKTQGFENVEERIVCSADNLSKLLYLDMFMLMCKKDTYLDKATWGLKYIEKGYSKLVLPGLQEEYKPLYESLKERYQRVLN